MAIKNLIAGGVGFNPGSVKFIPTLGFSIGSAVVTPGTLEEKIFTLLTATTTLTDTMGTKFYPNRAPQAVATPYAVYQRISGGQQSG
ncbi:unnamed protein product, partial [marine sediment metagenome]